MITKLAEKWRHVPYHLKDPLDCADDLEAALPKWTRITEDESTWPKDGQDIVHTAPCKNPIDNYWSSLRGMRFNKNDSWELRQWVNCHWRPLCDLDYPQEK